MQTFAQWLTEKFVTIVKGEQAWNARDEMDAQVGIYEKPTLTEACQKEAYSDGHYYLGGWLVPTRKTWYVWAREHVEHEKVRRACNVPEDGAVPVYLWYENDHCKVQLSSFSARNEDVTVDDIQPAIDKIPSFKKTFPNYTVSSVSY